MTLPRPLSAASCTAESWELRLMRRIIGASSRGRE
jgi:hypothetical protein